ncbi:MAG: 4-carboxy-4-hydroxy-2-oxoadipate aldolase/oxaloacetate decarboxylase [Lachnospiraceae bacterium]|nr:4-carboxy-4-hydroxy-2-oxoadipate aldolase/oxaloacetate decarboxylase [Lachnospiraceae bacterium]
MYPDVRKTRPLVSDALLDKFAGLDAATVHEAMGKCGAMTHEIRPVDSRMKLCGRALTVKCHPGDNLMLIKAVSMAGPGDVIVADMGHILDNGPFGEVLAVDCISHGCQGLIVTCSVRDSEALVEMNFPVFSAGISVFGTSKATKGTVNHPVVVGGILVNPGDIVLGDRDGVVVIPYAKAEAAAEAAMKRRESEAGTMERLRKGESLFEIYGYQKVFDALGVTEEA